MNRRSFMAAIGLAPIAAVPQAGKPAFASGGISSCSVPGECGDEAIMPMKKGIRVSSLKDDPGYRTWCELRGDGRTVKVFLDGIEQQNVSMADETKHVIHRAVRTSKGNLAVGHDGVLEETIYGDVRIKIA